MKTLFSNTAMIFLLGIFLSSAVFAIDDSVIFENIDSQKSLFSKIQNENHSTVPEFHKPSGEEIVIEDSQKSYAAKTSPAITTFDKEKVVPLTDKKVNQKKVEKIAQELREMEY